MVAFLALISYFNIEIVQRFQKVQERVLQICKQQADTEAKYWPTVKQGRGISHQQC